MTDTEKPQQAARSNGPESMLFSRLCTIFEEIARASSKNDKLKHLEKLWVEFRGKGSFYPLMRLILPQLDTQRATYGLKESKIAKYYIDLLGLAPTNTDAIRFKHWKDPSKNNVEATHFSDVVFVVLQRRAYCSSSEPQTLQQINAKLDELVLADGTEDKKAVMMSILRATSATEQKWLIRIILKEMKMHLLHGSVLGAFHPSAMELYNNTNDLAYVCEKCTDEKELVVAGDMKAGIFLMQPLKPMLASVVESEKLSILLRDERLIVEPKYDGERMMIHKNGDKLMYWTRNAKNYTSQYGPKFNHVLAAQIDSSVSNCILDGEFLLYDSDAKQFKAFGSNRTFAIAPTEEVDGVKLWFCYMVFDVVFLNGESLLQVSLQKRKELLSSIIIPKANVIEVVQHMSVKTIPNVLAALDQALQNKYEGIMLKHPGSHYIPGERKLKWMKLKPDHIAGMADTVDLVILGGYYGTKYGGRSLSHFLLGVWVNDSSAGPKSDGAKYWTVCKVGSGYSAMELQDLQAALAAKWIMSPGASSSPAWLDGWVGAAGDVPDVYIHPRDSVVLEVLGYSFQETTKFKFGQTIRFPRCQRVRFDKSIEDATDLEQLRRVARASSNFSRKAEAMEELVMVRAAKKARKMAAQSALQQANTLPARTIAVISHSIVVPSREDVQVLSDMFNGFEFCVLHTTPSLIDRVSLEKLILSHGGAVVANPQPQTSLLFSSCADVPKVQNWVRACTSPKTKGQMESKYVSTDIVHIQWLLDCVAAGKILPLAPRHLLHTSPAMAEKFRMTLDPFGDSYYDPCTPEPLRDSINAAIAAMSESEPPVKKTRPEEKSGFVVDQLFSFASSTRNSFEMKKRFGIETSSLPMMVCPVKGQLSALTKDPSRVFDEALIQQLWGVSSSNFGASPSPLLGIVEPQALEDPKSWQVADTLTWAQQHTILLEVVKGAAIAQTVGDATHVVDSTGELFKNPNAPAWMTSN